jgi:hypothetical protein
VQGLEFALEAQCFLNWESRVLSYKVWNLTAKVYVFNLRVTGIVFYIESFWPTGTNFV